MKAVKIMSKLPTVTIEIDAASLDGAIKKAHRLVELLKEAQQIINALKKD